MLCSFQGGKAWVKYTKKEVPWPNKVTETKNFSNLQKITKVKTSNKELILKADLTLFGHSIVTAQVWKLCMENVFSHPLGPLPWALATPEGVLRKTNKAKLASTQEVPGHSATIVYGMNLVQREKEDQATFGDVASTVLNMALRDASLSSCCIWHIPRKIIETRRARPLFTKHWTFTYSVTMEEIFDVHYNTMLDNWWSQYEKNTMTVGNIFTITLLIVSITVKCGLFE